jgi:hypothetical protein
VVAQSIEPPQCLQPALSMHCPSTKISVADAQGHLTSSHTDESNGMQLNYNHKCKRKSNKKKKSNQHDEISERSIDRT